MAEKGKQKIRAAREAAQSGGSAPHPAAQAEPIVLRTDAELKILTDPLRQRILWKLAERNAPMTAKNVADALGIAPSSAGHHLRRLERIGAVEIDRRETVHGIVATYYRMSRRPVSVSLDAQAQENEQRLLLENSLRLVEEGFWRHAAQLRAKTPQGGMMEALPESRGLRYCVDMLHLTDAELTEWNEMVRTFMDAHDGAHAAAGARPYHCALIWYEAGADEAQSAGTAGRQNEKK